MSKSAVERIKELQDKGMITAEQAEELLKALSEEPAGAGAGRRMAPRRLPGRGRRPGGSAARREHRAGRISR